MNGTQIKNIRLEQKLGQQEFAAALGYDRYATISEFENGARPVPRQVELILELRGWLKKPQQRRGKKARRKSVKS